jgi:hypothetical protein
VQFSLYQSGLYLAAGPSVATVAFLFSDSTRTDPTFTLSQSSWTDPAQQGYFAFFAPGTMGDPGQFSAALRAAFTSGGAQFGWFTGSGSSAVMNPAFIVQGSGTPLNQQLMSASSFAFRQSATLSINPPRGSWPTISYDDAADTFVIPNPTTGGNVMAQLTLTSPQNVSAAEAVTSANLLLPMSGPLAGTLQCTFDIPAGDLALNEPGVMYCGMTQQGGGPVLAALSYPVIAPAGGATSFNLAATLDVLQPTNVGRTFFQLTDAKFASYFASGGGQSFGLVTVPAATDPDVARFVFASRPVTAVTDSTYYYLALAGRLDVAPAPTAVAGTPGVSNALLCGMTGTEFFNVVQADTLRFVPNQAAYDTGKSSSSSTTGAYLDSSVLTSWVQYETAGGAYVAQPQQSPLYNGESSQKVALAANGSSQTAHILGFLPLATWGTTPTVTAQLTATAPARQTAPAVPLAPTAGLAPATLTAPYRALEQSAIYPQRRTNFMPSTPHALMADALTAAPPAAPDAFAMTPQGLIAGLAGTPPAWSTLQLAKSGSVPGVGILQFSQLGADIIAALQQNQVFLVITTTKLGAVKLFSFAPSDPANQVTIADWLFSLSPDGTRSPSSADWPNGVPPILILKFYHGQSISDLVGTGASPNIGTWTSPDVFNDPAAFTAANAQTYIAETIKAANDAVAADATSMYANFASIVNDPAFSGLVALNCNLVLNDLPAAIKGILGGMLDPTISAFRAHHVGVAINDTDPGSSSLLLVASSLFGLVDYEWAGPAVPKIAPPLYFQVEYLRALFLNAELREFACKTHLMLNNLFNVNVSLGSSSVRALPAMAGASIPNDVVVMGSYQAHSTTGDDSSSGPGVYSFVAEGAFEFDFDAANPYLDKITLTKLQFSFDQETPNPNTPNVSTIASSFGIWGSMVFKQLDVLDIFSFQQLTFADLKITVTFELNQTGAEPVTSNPVLTFSPGDLRLDLAESPPREGSTSLLALLPFKLTSFLYSQTADETLESLGYSKVGSIPGLPSVLDTFNYAVIFDLDLGTLGALVGSLAAFKFSVIVGWQIANPNANPPVVGSGIAFGFQLPEADGKLEIKIEGVLDLLIETFVLQWVTPTDKTQPQMLVVGLEKASLTIFGQRLPPKGDMYLALFVPQGASNKTGWLAAYNNMPAKEQVALEGGGGNANGGSSAFELLFLGGGQRVGPDATQSADLTDFQSFLDYMTGTGDKQFWGAFNNKDYGNIYHEDGGWLVVADMKLLGTVTLGFVFYDVTPFYSLTLDVEKLFSFEITYTKVTDTIGLFHAVFTLPDSLRTYQIGAASLTLPSLVIDVYTNGNFKVDLGFPASSTDWSRCFQVQAQAGPVPVTGAGGFYIASLSSATAPQIFKGDYNSILAFGFAAQLGIGKSFTMGPLSAGISVVFFGIIEGAAGYKNASADEIFKMPDALMLQGQFGIIGQLYGKLDFKIVTASVNITLSASIGIVMTYEPLYGNDGSILLYIEAEVDVSVEVSINLGLFSISVSFSFTASIRFQWQLAGSGSSTKHALRAAFVLERSDAMALTTLAPIPLLPNLPAAVGLLMAPELTVVFADTTSTGTPYVVTSLVIPYNNTPGGTTSYAGFQPFEAVAAQLATFALMHALPLANYNSTVTLDDIPAGGPPAQLGLSTIDQNPDLLVGWLDYPTLLQQLAVFSATTTVPLDTDNAQVYASVFPMPPFLNLATAGRLDANGKPADLNYQFSSKNVVPSTYVDFIDAYFNQLFVSQQTPESAPQRAAENTTTAPLAEAVFLEYFNGLIRNTVHQLLQTMQDQIKQDASKASQPLDQLMIAAVAAGNFLPMAGQMSSMFRGGVRLPAQAGVTLTVPGGTASPTTNPMYALLWQEFPAGSLAGSPPNLQYTVALTNPDSTQPWFKGPAGPWTLTSSKLSPYTGLTAASVTMPSTPVQLPFTNTGPQAFSFQNPTLWSNSGTAAGTIRPFPANLQSLQAAEAAGVQPGTVPPAIFALVQSRKTGAPYLPGGQTLPTSAFTWATQIQVTVKTVPSGAAGSAPLKDVYAISGASQANQQLLQLIIEELNSGKPAVSIADIQVLYQPTPGAQQLQSMPITPADVFALRTNTTTVSAPPVLMMAREAAPPLPPVPPGASLIATEQLGFLQILQQAIVTNAPGYVLRYIDTAGNSFPSQLVGAGPAQITLLIRYAPDSSLNTPASPAQIQPFYNAIILGAGADPSLLYYAETTDPALSIQYSAVSPGAIGVELTRVNDATMAVHPSSRAALALGAGERRTHHEIACALFDAGVTDVTHIERELASLGTGPAQLNSLYALVTYQVEATANAFIQSNLSAPVQPQAPVGAPPTAPRAYDVYAPLYNVATANQPGTLPAGVPPNRYASIDAAVTIGFYLNDAFGNTMPQQLTFSGTNLYFDPILPFDRWTGIVSSYDFVTDPTTKPPATQPNTFVMHLAPSATGFAGWTQDQYAAALELYYTVQTQITGTGVSFYVESNLCIDGIGAMVPIPVSTADTANIVAMVNGMIAYLTAYANAQSPVNPPPLPAPVRLVVTVKQTAPLPPVFEISALLGIQRDPALVAKDDTGNVVMPSAQNVATTVAPAVGGVMPDGVTPQPDLTSFATSFTSAFTSLKLSVGLNGAQQPQVNTTAGRTRAARAALGAPADSSGGGAPSAQSLWAVQSSLLGITIGTGAGLAAAAAGPFYLSPKPLDNTLNSQTVTLPVIAPPLPTAMALGSTQLFSDIDLDRLTQNFFAAVDGFLTPASAAHAFEVASDAYAAVATGRGDIAQEYSTFEVEWLFGGDSPFTGTKAMLDAARDAFAEQMRAALSAAYLLDTIVQYGVAWTNTVPSTVGDQLELFGTIKPAVADPNMSLSTAHVAVPAQGTGLLTFTFGTSDPAIVDNLVSLDLRYDVTHVQYFTQPASATPKDEARPSIWLQLVDPYGGKPPHVGPDKTIVPVVFREYPTPPTIVNQSANQGASTSSCNPTIPPNDNPLTAAAAWNYAYSYQAQLTGHDLLLTSVTYNTDLSATKSGGGGMLAADTATVYTLFEAICRFTAANAVIAPILLDLTNANWVAAATVFAQCVTDVVKNSDWNPPMGLSADAVTQLRYTTDSYVVTDLPANAGKRTITMTWTPPQKQTSFPGASICLLGIAPNGTVYPGQTSGSVTNGITDSYTPTPAISDDWVAHRVEIDNLNVLAAENALAGLQIERNLIILNNPGGGTSTVQTEFVYMTPLVRPSQPATPYIDNPTPIDITTLKAGVIATACPQSTPQSLCQRIFTMMNDLLRDNAQLGAMLAVEDPSDAQRRIKVGCGFQYPVISVAGVPFQPNTNPIRPVVPVVLARSFLVDVVVPDGIEAFSVAFASAIVAWSQQNGVTFGANAQPAGGTFIFDVTLYAELSNTNAPVLRLSNLQLALTDIDPNSSVTAARTSANG